MRKLGATCGFIAARNRELAEKARRMAVERGTTLKEVIDEAAESEASRFWIEEDRALRLVRELRNGLRERQPRRKSREAMISEIHRRAEAILRSDPTKNLPDAVYEVVNSPAPSYYVGARSVQRALSARKRGFVPDYRNRERKGPAGNLEVPVIAGISGEEVAE